MDKLGIEEKDLPSKATGPEDRRAVAKGRLEAFSDGVFAIAITLLVLELSIEGRLKRARGPNLRWPIVRTRGVTTERELAVMFRIRKDIGLTGLDDMTTPD